jgi:membrane-bound serine protease (ClpP class)
MIPAILLLGLGLLFVLAEVLFPSFGFLAVLATASIVGAVVLAFQESASTGVNFLIATALLVPCTLIVAFKILPRSPFGRYVTSPGLSFAGQAATDARDLELVGAEGVLEGPCKPAGIARLAGRRVDVVTRGEWLAEGERVRVLTVEGNRVVVAGLGRESIEPSEAIR